MGKVTQMLFYTFFNVGWRCDGITVDLGLEVTPQPNVARIQVGGSRRPSEKKTKADDSIITVFTQRVICGRAPCYPNTRVVVSHRLV
ncbi:hypothetical protein TNCV_2521761 [Trichonephila clavipes]|nr:hypothetical protein TNCV_2521761 [Trichonephila clavipes]